MTIAGLALFFSTVWLTYALQKNKMSIGIALLCLSLCTLFIRLFFNVNYETGADASIWIASAHSTYVSDNSLWWLLNSNEGRPLTVAPLLILPLLGIPLNYFSVDCIGQIMYVASFSITGILIANHSKQKIYGWIFVLPFFVVIASATHIDFFSYNSEAPSLLAIAIALWMLSRMYTKKTSLLFLFCFGILLGSLPFIKFQNAPAGIVIGISAMLYARKNRQWQMIAGLLLGAFTPALFVSAYFIYHGEWQNFLNDYFANYYYYSYTLQSSADSFWHRYSPRRIAAFILRPHETFVFSIAGAVCLCCLAFLILKKRKTTPIIFFAVVFFIANMYAVIQSGWNSVHYLLYLWIPASLLTAIMLSHFSHYTTEKVLLPFVALAVVALQLIVNVYKYHPPEKKQTTADEAIVKYIVQHTETNDKIHIWGYADRLYVLSERAMGMRLCNNWWITMPGPAQQYRIQEWLSDIEQSKPTLIVDNSLRVDPHQIQFNKISLQNIAPIAAYIKQNYVAIDTIQSAVIYRIR